MGIVQIVPQHALTMAAVQRRTTITNMVAVQAPLQHVPTMEVVTPQTIMTSTVKA